MYGIIHVNNLKSGMGSHPLKSKHLKGQLEPSVTQVTFLDQVSWDPPPRHVTFVEGRARRNLTVKIVRARCNLTINCQDPPVKLSGPGVI